MSMAILSLIEREQAKAERRRDAVAATKAEIDILGDSVKLRNKLARQEQAVKDSVAAIGKLNKALK